MEHILNGFITVLELNHQDKSSPHSIPRRAVLCTHQKCNCVPQGDRDRALSRSSSLQRVQDGMSALSPGLTRKPYDIKQHFTTLRGSISVLPLTYPLSFHKLYRQVEFTPCCRTERTPVSHISCIGKGQETELI